MATTRQLAHVHVGCSMRDAKTMATVVEMTEDTVTLDTNHPLAGCKLLLDVELKNIAPPSTCEVATFAGGCFWGLERAF